MIASDDRPRDDGSDRFALYTIRHGQRVRLAETSLDGVGLALVTLVNEGEFADSLDRQTPFGLFDRLERKWIRKPWSSPRWRAPDTEGGAE